MKRFLRNVLLATACGVILPAQAAVQSYTFDGVTDSGVFLHQIFSGSLSFDDSALANVGEEWIALGSIALDFLGQRHTLGNAAATPEAAFFDGTFLGVSFTVNAGDPQFSLVAGYRRIGEAFFAYDTVTGKSGTGSVTYTAAVPEPEGWMLMLAGLAVVVGIARRRFS
ncbi:MAG TPA: PEP-CTERM sorting domain-containing protein [Methyloversatilis sp.]